VIPRRSKACPYCMVLHSERGRCCCPEHERRVAAHVSSVSSGRSRALRRIDDRQQQLFVSKRRWRDIAAGRNVGANLREIFGFDPEETA
jgi:hypothetical protein